MRAEMRTDHVPTNYTLIVLHKLGGSLGFYDVVSGAEVTSVATAAFPHEVCLAPRGGKLYVSEYGLRGVETEGLGGNTIAVVDVKSRQRTGTISTGRYDRPHGIAAHSSGKLFVTSESTNRLLIFDLESEKLLHVVAVEQELPHITAPAPDGKTVYVANIKSSSLTAIDVESGTVLHHIPVLSRPEGMVFTPDGKFIYVVNRESRAIAVIDTNEKQMIDTIETGDGPVRIVMTPDAKCLAFPLFHADAVQIADIETGRVMQTIPVGRQPAGTTLSPDGRLLFVSCEMEERVYVISMKTYEVVGRIQTGDGPDSMVCLSAADLWDDHEQ